MTRATPLFALLASLTLVAGTALAADFYAKKDWSAKMQQTKRVSSVLCAADAYLLTCTTELTDPEDGAKKKLDAATCSESVEASVAYMLKDGSDGGPVGGMYNKLPANIGGGGQADEYASLIGKEVWTSMMGAVMQHGGDPVRTNECDAKMMTAFQVPGNF